MESERASDAPQERVVRVFVSSTFRDMRAERDELVKRVFPQLRKLCEERGVTWADVDLRWGITEEQSAEGEVLPICLAEIQRCRPYFIGLLGERYGWVPDVIDPELVREQPWLEEHREGSVTELEILHGVLNNPAMSNRACFYFRDPAYVERVPTAQRADFVESDPKLREKLVSLKDRIRQSGLALRENYPDPETLGRWVLKDLTTAINQAESKPNPLAREAAEHEAFARSRMGVYIGRQEYFDRLDAHAAGDGPPLVVLGESGSGKSALLANWLVRYREAHPGAHTIVHFIGANGHSTDCWVMLHGIMGQLTARLGIEQEIPVQPKALRLAFAKCLSMAAARGRVVLVLDALNQLKQLEDRDGAPDLVWLPSGIPENVRLVVSTLPGRALDDLTKRGWPVLQLQALDIEERIRLIDAYLAQYTKQLSPSRAERIASSPQAANPLYLRALLEELRVFGEHERLDNEIDRYLEADTVPALYETILERYEQDYERDRPGLVRDAMALLWAARRGLSEPELLDLLGTDGEPLPRARWSPLYLAAEQALVSGSGLISFFHDYLREAVEHRYLPTGAARDEAHLRLADYFESRDLGSRRTDELPWQLTEAHAWRRLYDLLADLSFFEEAWRADEFRVKVYWSQVEAASQLRLTDAYRAVLDRPDRHSDYVWDVSILLYATGHPVEALSLQGHLVEHYRRVGDRWALATVLSNQAVILRDRGDLDEAMALHKQQERICRELGNKAGLSSSLGSQALILYARGDLDGAMALHKQQERTCRELGNKAGLSRSLGNQALILNARGDLDGAMASHKQQERICRELGDEAGLHRSLGNQAVILADRDDLAGAMALHKEKERICRESGYGPDLACCLIQQSMTLFRVRGKRREAKIKGQEALSIYESLGLNREVLETKGLLFRARVGSPWVLVILMGVGGIVLGMLNRWLWFIGGSLTAFACLCGLFRIVMLSPGIQARVMSRAHQALANSRRER